MEHLQGLNDAQKEAVLCTEGPLLVLAGAGAGKTRVITHRILEIVHKGVAPEKILAITFTNKAASEMRERTIKLLLEDKIINRPVSERLRPPFISTFHSLGLTIIKENAKSMGYKRTPAIYDRNDSMRAVKEALKSLGLEDIEPRAALGMISRNKGEGRTAGEYIEATKNPRERALASVWMTYEHALAADQALDFDDLLLRSVRFLRENPERRAMYQARWPYIHIDEYQDTNGIQAEMVELLVGPAKNICAVGDIDQTIYGWRGAQIANILSFEKQFPGGKIVILEENYRSTKNILAAANEVIAKNVYRREKNLFTKNTDGEMLSLYQAFDELDEGMFIARKIKELISALPAGRQARDFCVLYRANFQSRAIEEALLSSDIPYQVLGTKFFERKEVKDVISFVRASVYGTAPDIARVANVPPRGIGKVTLLKMLGGGEAELGGAVGVKVKLFRLLLEKIKNTAQELQPSKLLQFVMEESGMDRMYKADKLEGAERLENVRELVTLAARYDNSEATPLEALEKFLESAALASDQDELKDEANSVRLMTVHAAKGLEYPHVFITGLEEGLFPYERDEGSESDREEERRLMYVAITRAKEKLYLSFAAYRTVFGSKNATIPSQFLSDIPEDLITNEAPDLPAGRQGARRTIYLD
ncbi:MAG TPA: UvrD-helicase domain-containing protein [Candidatus Paceibacterota bacterium]|nr:UvrD-helicase domain-containing protein [Candidatus Paceibacterota bacterium]